LRSGFLEESAADVPLRAIRAMTDEALAGLSRRFDRLFRGFVSLPQGEAV
jgi:hypothetical protein